MQFSRYLTYSKSNTSYRYVSWTLKIVLVITSLFYVVNRLVNEGTDFLMYSHFVTTVEFTVISTVVILLMIINWLLEAKKWQLIANPYIDLSAIQALKSVVTGVSLDAVLPMGTGAVTGKVLSLNNSNRNNLYLPVILAQGLQSFWTVAFGLIGIYQMAQMTDVMRLYSVEFKHVLLWGAIAITILIYLIGSRNRQKLKFLKNYSPVDWASLLGLSLLRYTIFLIQLMLFAQYLSPEIPRWILVGSATWMFFAKTIIPKPGHIGALGIRGASVIFFLQLAGYPFAGFVLATFLLWVINLAIPSFIGLFFIKDLHLSTDSR